MHISKKYLHDRAILVLLSVNAFFTVLIVALTLLRLSGGESGSYIVRYRSNLGLDAWTAGSALDFLFFVAIAISIMALHTYISMRMYAHRKHFAINVLALGSLLLILIFLVTNSLFALR